MNENNYGKCEKHFSQKLKTRNHKTKCFEEVKNIKIFFLFETRKILAVSRYFFHVVFCFF